MFLYEVTDGMARITACRSYDSIAVIPKQIGGYPVTELAPYAFSAERREDPTGVWSAAAEGELSQSEAPYLCGVRLREIYLPSTLKKIGNYAFYNCFELEAVHSFSTIRDIGSGVFTGCGNISRITMEMEEGEVSCLPELLSELRQKLTVTCKSSGGTAKLVLPEFFEDSVENTPARILMTQMHGCGHRYRYCFTRTGCNYREYDALFPHIKVQEPEEIVLELVIGRLLYPHELQESAKEVYSNYLKKHWQGALRCILKTKDNQQLSWLINQLKPNQDRLQYMAETAGAYGDAQAFGTIMDYGHEHVKKEKKKFRL